MKQIKDRTRVRQLAEVFTAEREIKAMLDLIDEGYWALNSTKKTNGIKYTSLFDISILEPSCGNGNFLVEILHRRLVSLKEALLSQGPIKSITDFSADPIFDIFASIYGVDIAEDNVIEARARMLEELNKFFTNMLELEPDELIIGSIRDILDKTIIQGDFLKQPIEELFPNSKFNVIIGNPPYQDNDILTETGERSHSASPLYHLFIKKGLELEPDFLTLITPTRWVFGGKGLDGFRNEMLADTHITHLVDYWNSRECFPDVEIKGGVSYFLWCKEAKVDKTVIRIMKNGEIISEALRKLNEYDIFIRSNQAVEILEQVNKIHTGETFDTQVLSRNPYGIPTNIKTLTDQPVSKDDLEVFGNGFSGFMPVNQLQKNLELVEKYKVIVAKAGDVAGERNNFKVCSRPRISAPHSVNTETYLVCGIFDTEQEALNCKSYIETRFFRFMLWLRTQTQNISKDKFKFIPVVDYTKAWTDEELYKKFNLTKQQIEFIESIIRTY